MGRNVRWKLTRQIEPFASKAEIIIVLCVVVVCISLFSPLFFSSEEVEPKSEIVRILEIDCMSCMERDLTIIKLLGIVDLLRQHSFALDQRLEWLEVKNIQREKENVKQNNGSYRKDAGQDTE